MSADDQLHRLLDDAVSDVEPSYGLDRIRARTGRRARRGWAWAAGTALATAAMVAVVVALGGFPGTTGGDPGPATDGSGTGSGTDVERVVYFVAHTGVGPRLMPEVRTVGSAGAALDETVEDAVSGSASDPDYDSPWPDGAFLQRAQLSAGVLSVDLSGPVVDRPAGMARADAALAVQQLVWTAQANAGVRTPVTFLVDGRPTDTLLGTSTGQPVPAAASDDVLAPVSVLAPGEGSTVDTTFTVRGKASAFEATVQWELRGAGGVVRKGFATAKECCTVSPYSFTVTAPPGEYTLVVHDVDVSDGEGNPQSHDTKRLTVR
jgi:hypothetical protein